MLTLLMALLQQGPALVEPASTGLSTEGPWAVKVSTTGKFVALVHLKGVILLETSTFKVAREIEGRWTGLGFDEKDEILTLAGESLVRVNTATWAELVRGSLDRALPGHAQAKALGYGESLVGRAGRVVYVAQKGGLSIATVVEGKVVCAPVEVDTQMFDGTKIRRILADTGPALIVQMDDDPRTGVVLLERKRVYPLAASAEPLGAALMGDSVALLCRKDSPSYSTRTWKHQRRKNSGEGNVAGTFDLKRSLTWAIRGGTLVAWSEVQPEAEIKFPDVKGDFSAMDVSADGTRLFAVEGKTLRCWRVKD